MKNVRDTLAKAYETAEIGKRLLHDSRRTAVRNLFGTVDQSELQRWPAVTTTSVFDRYNIVSDTDLKLASQKMEAHPQAQMGTVSGTVTKIEKKRGKAVNA